MTSSSLRRAIAVLMPCVAALGGCGGGTSMPRTQLPVPVTAAQAEARTVPLALRAVGHVEAIASVAIRPRVGGELQKVHFGEGQPVTAGQTLFTIDPRPYQAALREAEARLARDRALLHKAEIDVVRYEDLARRDFVTREQFDQVKASVESLRATVAADIAAVDSARLQLEYCTVTSPVTGRTGTLGVKTGNLVKANDDKAMVTVNQIRPIHVSFAVPAEHLEALRGRAGDGLLVNAHLPDAEGAPETGKLVVVDNTVDVATSTILLKAVFPNEGERLWPGQFVDVELVLEEQQGRLVVPAAAVQTGQKGTYVYVVDPEGKAEQRPVKLARQNGRYAVLDEGVKPGETVVTDGQLRLVPGAKVEVKQGLGASDRGQS
ncbi:MAG: efflux RND transporter periplasmic adaptor subunit [Thermoanaerobaculaceae bacterium]|nr:efflux RND transporter periplasmic adaptor subunit [Thermoanaerobaculaceae bacterium]MDI9621398.1 efflux RND transporter periplasmic adaptor subunit [Acidobacteriota bacterium]HPW55439.1 efflux RND transporter periplasmic adaptor subunit [Thermoanaerobaculaceae bacterium]